MTIRKRILSMFTSFTILMSFVGAIPITASAAEPHTHKVCSNADCSDNHEDITWTAWDSAASLPTAEGNYYLTKDITLSRYWTPADSISLCLNGHTITLTNSSDCVISMKTGSTFNLCDCIGSGTITGGKSGGVRGGTEKSTFNMYGGKISGNSGNSWQDSSGVYLSNGTFNMYGGEISGNTDYLSGGGVGIYKGAFNMYGGKISGNSANFGGGVWVIGTFKMLGGEISGNTAPFINGNEKGGVMLGSSDSVIEIGGKVIIDNNTANDIASNFYLGDEESIIISKPLTDGANIGITTESAPTEYKKINITGENDADYSTFFHSDNDDYKIINGENNVVQLELPEKYRISQQPTAENGYTVIAEEKINEMWQTASPSYQWYEADIKVYNVASEDSENEIGAEAIGGTYNGSGVWQDENGAIGVAFSSLNAGDTITVTPSAGFDGQIMAVKLDTYDIEECIENNGVYSFAPAEDGMYGIAIQNMSDSTSFTAEITLTRTDKIRIDGQTAAALTAGENGKTYVCDVTFNPSGDNETLSTTPVEYVQHTHKVCCGTECADGHTDITWTAWTSDNSLPTEAGNYYLTKNVTIDCEWVPTGTTNLCLNGYILESTEANEYGRVIDILSNSELSLCDCSSAQTGKITGGTPIGVGFSRLVVGEKTAPVFNMYGGTISGINYPDPENPSGAAVDVSADNGEFHMYGGKITDNGALGIQMYAKGNVFLSGTVDISNNGSSYAQMMSAISDQLAAAGINLGNIGTNIDISIQKGNAVQLEAPVTMANKSSIFMPSEDKTFSGTFTQGWNEKMSGKNPKDYFTSAADAFEVKLDDSGEAALAALHTHPICGTGACTDPNHASHEDITWTAWESDNSLPTEAGNYYLTTDVVSTSQFRPDGIRLCLNNHTINYNAGDIQTTYIQTGCTFDLCDCGENGKLLSPEEVKDRNTVSNHGTFNMYGGTLSGKTSSGAQGLGVSNAGTFNMYGGKITDNHTEYGTGGGVNNYEDSSVFNMYGGEISGNTANAGGGVGIFKGSFYMYGGKITGNEATLYGGGIDISDTAANVVIKGDVSKNKSEGYGGGICTNAAAKIIDAKITGNTAPYSGGVCEFFTKYPIITIGGNTVISGNTKTDGETPDNLMVFDASKIAVDNVTPLTEGAQIGVSYYWTDYITETAPFDITGTNNADYSKYFKSDDEAYFIKNTDGNIVQLAKRHTHTLVHKNTAAATCTAAGNEEYWKCEGENGCGKMFSDADGETEIPAAPIIAATGHTEDNGESTIQPTCMSAGMKTYKCTKCKEVIRTESVAALGHKYGKWELTLTDTSTEVIRTCENDGSHQEKKNAEIQLVIPMPYTYSGTACEPKASVKVFEGENETALTENTDYSLSYENNVNAGTATVKITGMGNYSGTAERTFNIAAKTINAAAATAQNRVYDGTKTVTVTGVTLDGVCGDDTVAVNTNNLTGTVASANAGDYTQVTLSGLTLVNNNNNNYVLHQQNITVPTSVNVKIEKADVPSVTAGSLNIANHLKKEYTYLLSRLCPQINEDGAEVQKDWGSRSYEIVSVSFTQDGYYEDNTARIGTAESGGTVNNTLYLPIKFNDTDTTGKVATVTIKVSSDNYNDFTNTFEVHASNKKAVTFGGITAQDGVYNGSPWSGYTGDLTITDSDNNAVSLTPEIRYIGRLETAYSEKAEPPTNAGTYSVIFRVADTDENYIGKRTVNFEVTKADGTASVTMANFEFGGTPSVPVPMSATNGTDNVTYMYKPQGAEDSAYTSVKPTVAGSYTVKAVFAETQNYKQAEATADFTISHDYSDTWKHDATNHWRECSCGSRTDEAEHIWNAGEVTQEATCTLEGRTRYACTVCGREKVETTAALGHKWGAWRITAEPTLTITGMAERVCENNNEHKDIVTLPVLTDTSVWTAGTKVEPTETTDGSQEYTSEYGTVTVTIPATGGNRTESSEIVIKDGTPNVTVDGLDELAKEIEPLAKNVKITMTVESKAENSTNAEHSAIKTISANGKLDYLDISLTKTVDSVESSITETARTLKIVIPFDMTGKKNVKVYRYHAGSAELLSESASNDEYYAVDDGVITVYAKKFSTYAIGYDTEPTVKPSYSGGGSSITSYKVTFKAGENGKITKGNSSVSISRNAKIIDTQIPEITANDGYKFIGWGIDGKTTVDPTAAAVTKAITFTALYEAETTEPTTEPTQEPTSEAKQHKAYIVGYEGKFIPDGNITRAETAAILARLTDGFNENESYISAFPDVVSGAWYANYIGFEEKQNVINGYEDGTFKPEESITRAEFASMITHFSKLNTSNADIPFADTGGHWAAEQIAAGAGAGYIKGYEDNTFRPEHYITRAEAVAIINRMLDRNDITEFENPFTDVSNSHWAYADIIEAAVTHDVKE